MWNKLPLYWDDEKLKDFCKLYEKWNVLLIKSGTGSGKTVVVPKIILALDLIAKRKSKIVMTNPKKLITKSNAEYSALTLD